MAKLKTMTDWAKLQKLLEKEDDQGGKPTAIDERAFLEHLRGRVRGQDTILEDVVRLLRLQFAMRGHDRPLANLLFLGPTGTGKTELAKAIAEFLYGSETAMIRFDCSEFSSSANKDRLIGLPTGYVGAEQGGQLTRAMFANPRRVILFDEIEKAYTGVFDLFLQMMGEGRLTEQSTGKTADFTQSIIILTSNAHAEEIGKIQKENREYVEMLAAVKGYLADAKVFRPEILGRLDKVYVFDTLSGPVIAEIALLKIAKLGEKFGLAVDFVEPEILAKALAANKKISRFGIRELERILFDMFAASFAEAKDKGVRHVKLSVDGKGNVRLT